MHEAMGRLLDRYFPLAIAFLASGAYFIAIVLLKSVLSPEEFGSAALLFTFLSLISTFGLLGVEQALVRTATIDEHDSVELDMSLTAACVALLPVASLLISQVFEVAYASLPGLLLASVLTAWCMLAHNILKLCQRYRESLLASNSWKLAVAGASAIALFEGVESIEQLADYYNWCIAILAGAAGLAVVKVRRQIRLRPSEGSSMSLAANYLVSMFLLSVTTNIDRLVGEKALGLARLGDYFFASTVIVFPIAVVAGYVGTRLVVEYRKRWPDPIFSVRIATLFLQGVVIAAAIAIGAVLISGYVHELRILLRDPLLIAVLVVIAGIRLAYSCTSAAVGAQVSSYKLRRLNGLVGGLVFAFTAASLMLVNSILHLAIAFLLLWSARLFLFAAVARSIR